MKKFFCVLCDKEIEDESLHERSGVMDGIQSAMDHFRVLHPDVFAELERWPDGTPVVLDDTLEPDDFESEGE